MVSPNRIKMAVKKIISKNIDKRLFKSLKICYYKSIEELIKDRGVSYDVITN